jgi:hypothetical protein
MEIQINKFGNESFPKVVKQVSREDVDIVIDKPSLESDRLVRGRIIVSLKPEVQNRVRDVCCFGLDEGDYRKSWTRRLDFRGCRQQESKDAKINQAIMNIAGQMFMQQEEIIEKGLQKINDNIEHRIQYNRNNYEKEVKRLLLGENLSKEWRKEHLEDADLKRQIDELQKQKNKLQEQQNELLEKQREAVNKNMFFYLVENDWNAGDEHDPIVPELRDDIAKALGNNEGFECITDVRKSALNFSGVK